VHGCSTDAPPPLDGTGCQDSHGVMLVLSWNINAIRGIESGRLEGVAAVIRRLEPDVALFQEVGWKKGQDASILRMLEQVGLGNIHYSGDHAANKKLYGCVVASRHPMRPHDSGWAKAAPRPQLLARATVVVDGTEVDCISAHIPNGSGNGWNKPKTFEALADALRNAPDMPRVLGGDFNEPREVRPNGQIVTFGERVGVDGSVTCRGKKTGKCGETHPRRRWDAAVRAIFAGETSHGLRRAHAVVHGVGAAATTHVVKRQSRFFDHLFVSRHFEVEEADYDHGVREQGVSDHSAAWVRVRSRE